jgi:hypothetical protein
MNGVLASVTEPPVAVNVTGVLHVEVAPTAAEVQLIVPPVPVEAVRYALVTVVV